MTVVGDLIKSFTSDLNIFKEGGWLDAFFDTDLKGKYEALKPVLKTKYGTDAAKFVGFLEDSESLWGDVKSASEETGVDPNLLYSIGMQEGIADERNFFKGVLSVDETGEWFNKYPDSEGYHSERAIDTFEDTGLDSFFSMQDTLVQKGYLDSPIQSKIPLVSEVNEAGDTYPIGVIDTQDSWRAFGATIREYEDNLENIFANRDMDFNSLSENDRAFWIYSAYNAGPGNAAKLLDTYGSNPLEDQGIQDAMVLFDGTSSYDVEMVEWYLDPNKKNDPEYSYKIMNASRIARDDERFNAAKAFLEYSNTSGIGAPFMEWMNNVGRTIGSKELLDVYNPFAYTQFGKVDLANYGGVNE